jgi:hypothetical protein
MNIDAYRINPVGIRLTTGAASANTQLPRTSDGRTAKVVRIVVEGTGHASIALGVSGVVASNTSILVNSDPLYLITDAATHIGHIQGTAAAVINVTAIEL